MKLSVQPTVTTLAAVKKRLLTELKTYTELKGQRDAIDHAMKRARGSVEGILQETGEASVKVEGYSATLVAPVRKTLDPQRLLELGVSIDTIKAATVEQPQTPYLRITAPGGRDE